MVSPSDPHWTAYFSALGPLIVAVIAGGFGAYVVWRQWRTAQNRLKFDLFEKRHAIYKSGLDLINAYVSGGGIDKVMLSEYFFDMQDARWLFTNDLAVYLDSEIFKPIVRHERIWDALKRASDDKVPKLEFEQDALEDKIEAAVRLYDSKFEPFLQLRH